MNDTLKQFRDFFVSLKLTVVLLVLGIILIFAATIDQVHLGIWAVQEKYFRSFFVMWRAGEVPIPVFPGGYFIGGLLLINLVAAHVYRFSFTLKKTGIQITHFGLILLLLGELMTGLWQKDFSMRLEEGKPKNYSEAFNFNELAVIDTTDPQFDDVVAIPEKVVADLEPIQHPKLPFRVVPKLYYPNSDFRVVAPGSADAQNNISAKVDDGRLVSALPEKMTYKPNEANIPTAHIELIGPQGSLGTFMVSTLPVMVQPTIEFAGRTYRLAFRQAREYKPFTLTLLKFSHDLYAGTNIPKNFSSQIRLQTPDGSDNREVLIYMNNPLRYAGLTFFQASFEEGNDKVTILQVVRNPSWLIPYVSCSLMSLGLLWQFGYSLKAFANKRRANRTAPVAA